MADTPENLEYLEKAGFTPEQASEIAQAIENAGQYLVQAIGPRFDAIDRRFEAMDRWLEAFERTLTRASTTIAIVGGGLALVILIGFAILGYLHAVR